MEEEVKRLLDQRTKLEDQKKVKKEKLDETLAGMDSDFEQYQTDDILTRDKQQDMYEQERNEYKKQAEAEISQIKADIDRKNSEIGLALRKVRDGLIAEVAHYKPDYSEKEKALKTKEIELKIAKDAMEEAEAKYNHQMMKFYYYDDKSAQKLDDSEVLSSRKDYNELLVEFNSMLRELNQLKAKDTGVVKNLNSKIERINQFFGTVDIRKTSADKILDALEDEEFDVQIPLDFSVQQPEQTEQETTKPQQDQPSQTQAQEFQETQDAPRNNEAEKEPQKLPVEKLAKSGIKADDIEISQIDFDISTGKISVGFTANKDTIEMNVDMGNKLLSPKQMNKYFKQNNISIDGKMDPYIVFAINQSAEKIMNGLGIIDKAKIKDFAEKYTDTYRNSLGTNVDLQELRDEELESLTGIRYFKSQEKCDKNNFKYLMPYMREAKESTCSNVEVDTRKWYEILRDGVKSIFNKTLRLGDGKTENKEKSQEDTQIKYESDKDKEEKSFLESIKVQPVEENQEHTDELMDKANQELAKTLLNSSVRNVANENINAAAKKVKAEKESEQEL